ncbi:MAG: hypothetical protein LBT77_01030 [Mycoplasmataceae bacterium]|jgi:hypothetical protein|nr:hypothetical protein [Mycoplasmataceae bacterium]
MVLGVMCYISYNHVVEYNYKITKRSSKDTGQVDLKKVGNNRYTLADVIERIDTLETKIDNVDSKLDNVIKLNNLKTK